MEKDISTAINSNSIITITDRKKILITGVKKIDSFNDEEFLVETSFGYMIIKGEQLEIIKLDTFQGNVSIKGLFNSLAYIDAGGKKDKKESVVSRLFK